MINFIKKNKIVIISVIIGLLIELLVCNYPAIRTIIIGNQLKPKFMYSDREIEIPKIDTRVTSILINYKNELTDKITYLTTYKSIENSAEFKVRDKVILSNAKHYINLDTHNTCKSIKIDMITESNIDIESIEINTPCFNFNIYRIIVLILLTSLVLRISNGSVYRINYNGSSKYQNRLSILMIIIVFLIICEYILIQFGSASYFIPYEDVNKDDALLVQTESFLQGHINLDIEVSEELLNMDDPYDSNKRDTEGVPFAYDVAFYNGKYYSYFGITPIITLILPFRLLTGGYTHCYIFNLVYLFGIMISLYAVYKKLVDKYISNISYFNFNLGYYTVLFGANIFTLLRGMKYDIAVSAGIMFILLDLFVILKLKESQKYRVLKLVLIGLFTGFIVLSKPNFIVYYILLIYFGIISLEGLSKKEKIRDIMIIAIPLGVLAILQMIYNYLRFDNILEFGAKYQLTGFNMNYCMNITIGKAFAGIIEYIFRMPEIRVFNFPFVVINNTTELFRVNELLYENRLYGLAGIPVLWILLFKKNILKENNELNKIINLVLIVSLISIIINTSFGGICEVYAIDFKLLLCIFSVLLLLKLTEEDNKEMHKLFLVLCVLTILLMLPINFTTENNYLTNFGNDFSVYLKNIFEFWN